jgi:hypothetical protein
VAAAPDASFAAPRIEVDTTLATAGYYTLRWSAAATEVEVAAFGDPDSSPDSGVTKLIYTGSDRATVLSGQTDGTRVYRVRAIGTGGVSAWSEPVTVTVAHHSLSRALTFLTVGAVVFLATLALIVRGARGDV